MHHDLDSCIIQVPLFENGRPAKLSRRMLRAIALVQQCQREYYGAMHRALERRGQPAERAPREVEIVLDPVGANEADVDRALPPRRNLS